MSKRKASATLLQRQSKAARVNNRLTRTMVQSIKNLSIQSIRREDDDESSDKNAPMPHGAESSDKDDAVSDGAESSDEDDAVSDGAVSDGESSDKDDAVFDGAVSDGAESSDEDDAVSDGAESSDEDDAVSDGAVSDGESSDKDDAVFDGAVSDGAESSDEDDAVSDGAESSDEDDAVSDGAVSDGAESSDEDGAVSDGEYSDKYGAASSDVESSDEDAHMSDGAVSDGESSDKDDAVSDGAESSDEDAHMSDGAVSDGESSDKDDAVSDGAESSDEDAHMSDGAVSDGAVSDGELTTPLSNHLPENLYDDFENNPMAQCFAGFYGADGWSSNQTPITGIGLRATDFPFLYHLLRACGVPEPQLRFYKGNMVSKIYNAAFVGNVRWHIRNQGLVKCRAKLGLPSSKIRATNVSRARSLLLSLDLLSLLRLILFWVAGDGCINYDRRPNQQYYLDSITIDARDLDILPLMQEALESHNGLEGCCTVTTSKAGHNRLSLKPRGRLDEPILDALDTIPISVVHPKLKLLQSFLRAEKRVIGHSYGSSRKTFHQYLSNDLQDKLLLVLAQDFHCLKLHAVNAILDFAGFRGVTKIDDFNLLTFKEQSLELEVKNGPKTVKQTIFLAYLTNCKKRAFEDAVPNNPNPEAAVRIGPLKKTTDTNSIIILVQLQCKLCKGEQIFVSRSQLQNHMCDVHGQAKHHCPIAGCNNEYKTTKCLEQHMKTKHSNKKFRCRYLPCTMVFGRKSAMKLHAKRHSASRKRFHCKHPGCGKSYSTKSSLTMHEKTHKKTQERFYCNHPGCTKSYPIKPSLARHKKTHKKTQERFHCNHPGCTKSYGTNQSLRQHKRKAEHW